MLLILKRCVYVASDGGRVCRPLVIADEGISRIKEHHMKELRVYIFSASVLIIHSVLQMLNATFIYTCTGWGSQF